MFKKSDFNVNAKGFHNSQAYICRFPLNRPQYVPQRRKVFFTFDVKLLLARSYIRSSIFNKFRLKYSMGGPLKGSPVKTKRKINSSTKKARLTGKNAPFKAKVGLKNNIKKPLKKSLSTTPRLKVGTKRKFHKNPKGRNPRFFKGNRNKKWQAGRAQMDNQKKKIFVPHGLTSMAGGLVEELTKTVYNVSITL